MIRSRDWETIKKNIEDGVFKLIRLVKIIGGDQREIIVPFNNLKGEGNKALERFLFIKSEIDSGRLQSGTYQIECRLTATNQGITKVYKFEIKEKNLPDVNVQDHTNKQDIEYEESMVDQDKYLKAVEEKYRLQAMVDVLTVERDFYKKLWFENGSKVQHPLADAPQEKTLADNITETVKETIPSLFNLAEQFFDMKRQERELKEKELNFSNDKVKIKRNTNTMGKSIEQQAQELAQELEQLNDDELDIRLDEMEANKPELYELVCEILGIDFDDEQENENDGGNEQ